MYYSTYWQYLWTDRKKLSNEFHSTQGIYMLAGEEIPHILGKKNIHSAFTTAMLMLITMFMYN